MKAPSEPAPSRSVSADAERALAQARAAAEQAATDAGAVAHRAAGRAAEAASGAAHAVASRSARAAQAALGSVRSGLEGAQRRLADERAAWDRLAESAELPELSERGAMVSLATRLDREAELWRALAIDRMRPAAPRAVALGGAAVGLCGATLLALIGALGGLFGSSATAGHLWAGAGALAIGVATSLACAAWLDRSARRASDEALLRADRAERSLHRVAAILALAETGDVERHRDALARLERG